MRSPTWAWPTLATAALYWFWVLVSSRSSAASTCSLAGVAWIEAVEIGERLLDRRLVLGDELQPRVDRRELEVEPGSRRRRVAVGAGHRAPGALLRDQRLERGDPALEHLMRALPGA